MKQLMIAAAVAAMTFGVFAENGAAKADPAKGGDEASIKAELTKETENASIQAEFDEPDGAAISLKEDGSFAIFGRGTGTYDFDDVDDVNDAKKEAVLKAKAAIAKFMKEKLSTEEGLAEASKKVKTSSSNGETSTVNVSKESIKTSATMIMNQADALLKGAITLKMQKIARKGSTGEIQATVGISSKTLKAVGKVVNGIAATPEQGANGGATSAPAANPTKGGNSSWTQTSSSDF